MLTLYKLHQLFKVNFVGNDNIFRGFVAEYAKKIHQFLMEEQVFLKEKKAKKDAKRTRITL